MVPRWIGFEEIRQAYACHNINTDALPAGHCHNYTSCETGTTLPPASWIACRIDQPNATAPLVSPCTRICLTFISSLLPEIELIQPSCNNAMTRCKTTALSSITAPGNLRETRAPWSS